jgi:hypothetical protein
MCLFYNSLDLYCRGYNALAQKNLITNFTTFAMGPSGVLIIALQTTGLFH